MGLEKLTELIARFAPAARRVLDVGCGAGVLSHFLDPDSHDLFGLELSQELAARALRRYRGVAVADLEEPWPLADGCVDVVAARAVLEHVFDYHALLNEANRTLTDGGLLLVEVPNLGYWRELRKLLVGKQPHWARDMQHVHVWTKRFLCQLLQAHGFTRLSVECDRLKLPLLAGWRWRWLERVWARWGNTLIVASRRDRRVRVVDFRLAGLHGKTRPVGSRWVEVLD